MKLTKEEKIELCRDIVELFRYAQVYGKNGEELGVHLQLSDGDDMWYNVEVPVDRMSEYQFNHETGEGFA